MKWRVFVWFMACGAFDCVRLSVSRCAWSSDYHCVKDREADAVCGVGERAFSRAAVRPREIRRRSGDSSHGQVVRELKTVWGPIYKS